MLLFQPEHKQPILERIKTQTRRLWLKGPRVKVGGVYQCRARMLDKSSTFARVRIKRRWREHLVDISEADARAEGYGSASEYLNAFHRINPRAGLNPLLWCVEFELVEAADGR